MEDIGSARAPGNKKTMKEEFQEEEDFIKGIEKHAKEIEITNVDKSELE